MLPTAKIPHIMNHAVKALKSIPSAPAPSKLQYLEAKTHWAKLLEPKSKKPIFAPKNVTASMLVQWKESWTTLWTALTKALGGLMTEGASTMFNRKHTPLKSLLRRTQNKQKMRLTRTGLSPPSLSLRPIPQKFTPLHSIIPESEWKALVVSPFDVAETDREKIALLPFRKSNWVNAHLRSIGESTGKSKKKNLYAWRLFHNIQRTRIYVHHLPGKFFCTSQQCLPSDRLAWARLSKKTKSMRGLALSQILSSMVFYRDLRRPPGIH